MKYKHLFIMAASVFCTSALRAEFNTSSIVINAKSDPRNAPAIIAMAAIENPKYTLSIVRAAAKAMPNLTVYIVKAVLKVDPKDAPEIVRQAILAQPSLAVEITTAAVALLPDQAQAITTVAAEASPASLRDAVSALSGTDSGPSLGNGNVSGGAPVSPSFPSQPVDAGLISPAS
jgi:hypothetical protein